MKKLLLVCAFVVGASAVSFAQGGGRAQQTPAQQLDRLKAAVTGITDDQAAKITAVYTSSAKSMDSLRTADPTGMREKMAPMRAASNAKIRAVLTPDQAKQFDALPARGGRGGGGGGGNN